jgi:hypothetical protein
MRRQNHRERVMSKLRIVAGTDVEAPAPRRQNGPARRKEVDHLLKPTLKLFERYKQARLEYERAVEDRAHPPASWQRISGDAQTACG